MKSCSRLVLAALCLTLCAGTARAGDEGLLRSEEWFVARMGERAVAVAPGVYEVEIPTGGRVRVGFGAAARQELRDRLQAELQAAKAAPAPHTPAVRRQIQALTSALRGLADPAPGLDKAAVTGATCNNNYLYSLDGGHNPGMVGGTTWSSARIGKDIDFGPAPPSYPKRAVYTYVATKAFPNQSAPDAKSDYKEVLSGLGTASTSVTIDCGSAVWFCAYWRSMSYVQDYGCSDGFRMIDRSN